MSYYFNTDRNSKIVESFLNGCTLSACAKQFNLTPERIRQIVAKYCRQKNRLFYETMPGWIEGRGTNSKWLRENKDEFLGK